MRRGEVFKLKWEDVDFDRGFIHIRQPKGGKDQSIPLNRVAREVLQAHDRISDFVFPGAVEGNAPGCLNASRPSESEPPAP